MSSDAAVPAVMQRNGLGLAMGGGDAGGDTITLTFSSELPYLRDYPYLGQVWEVLGHGPGEVDMSRLSGGAVPLLRDHKADLDSQVGVIVSAEIRGGRGVATARFSTTAAAAEMFGRVRSGEVRNVSVGYTVQAHKRTGEKDGRPVLRATRWTPNEISLVAVPADASVGVGRAATEPTFLRNLQQEPSMQTDETNLGASASITAERQRAADITAIGAQFGVASSDVSEALRRGDSVPKFRAFVMHTISDGETPALAARSTLHRSRISAPQPFSLIRSINAAMSGDWAGAEFERECHEELRRHSGKAAGGVFVPAIALATRDLLTTTNAASLIGTTQMSGDFIDALRQRVQVLALGATVLPGLRQNVTIPRMPTGTSAQWIAEDAAATESTPTFDAVTLTLKQLSANTRMSRKQVKQSDPALETILRADLFAQIAVGVDAAAISGAGSATVPRGILNTVGIGNVQCDGAITWPAVTALMAAVEQANAPEQALGWLTNPKVKAAMLSTPKFPGGDTAILGTQADGFEIAGHRAAFTSLVPSNLVDGAATGLSAMIYGDWSQLLVGQWGGIDIIVDDMTESTKGNVRITAHSEWDIAVRHAGAFAAMKDIAA
jgi:HK97 family phage major capsid protein